MPADRPVGSTGELNEHKKNQPTQIHLDVWGRRRQKLISFDQRSVIIAASKC